MRLKRKSNINFGNQELNTFNLISSNGSDPDQIAAEYLDTKYSRFFFFAKKSRNDSKNHSALRFHEFFLQNVNVTTFVIPRFEVEAIKLVKFSLVPKGLLESHSRHVTLLASRDPTRDFTRFAIRITMAFSVSDADRRHLELEKTIRKIQM